jgi:uncharacterized protein
MVMANLGIQGRFLWQGLMTVDPAAAGQFYGNVVGWKSEAWSADPSYINFIAPSGPVAGMSALPEANRAQGARGNWMAYIGTDDVDATVSQAEKLGAKVVRPAGDIPQVGRVATLTDPQGANFGVFKPLPSSAPPKGPPKNGDFAWHELSTSDPEAALKFYQELFGWQLIQKMDMGPMVYYVFGADGVQRGGMYKPSHPTPGAAWLGYVEVADADKAAVATTKAGGHVLNGPMDVPGGGRIAQLADSHGVPFAVHAMSKPAAAAAPKPSAAAASPAPPKPAAPKPAAPKPAAPKPAPAAAAPKPAPAAAPKPAPAAAPKPAPAAAAAPKKPVARKKAVAKKAAPRKAAPKKAAPRKAAPRKAAARKSTAKPARKSAARKKVARKAAGKAARKVARKGKGKTPARKAKRSGGKARRKK